MYKFNVKFVHNGKDKEEEVDAETWLLAVKAVKDKYGDSKMKILDCNMVKANG